jgi:hypothetical protein
MGKKSTTKCNQCDKEFDRCSYEIRKAEKEGRKLYCSSECFQLHRKEHPSAISEIARSKMMEAGRRGNATMKSRQKSIDQLKCFNKIRKRIFLERGRRCEECGWDKKNPFNGIIPVQVDHIDGDRNNNSEENLKVLCPNCHSMTKKFMFYGMSHTGTYGEKGTKRSRTGRQDENTG